MNFALSNDKYLVTLNIPLGIGIVVSSATTFTIELYGYKNPQNTKPIPYSADYSSMYSGAVLASRNDPRCPDTQDFPIERCQQIYFPQDTNLITKSTKASDRAGRGRLLNGNGSL